MSNPVRDGSFHDSLIKELYVLGGSVDLFLRDGRSEVLAERAVVSADSVSWFFLKGVL